jgi:hypothetical protein
LLEGGTSVEDLRMFLSVNHVLLFQLVAGEVLDYLPPTEPGRHSATGRLPRGARS